jgi:hypothetical protein
MRNEANQGAAYSIFTAIQSCSNDEIVCIVDGDDWLLNVNVLQSLNEYYADPNVWLTYGQSIHYPSCKRGDSKPIDFNTLKEGSIREKPWMTSHLNTFYAGLFKKIKLEDFLCNGAFIRMAVDEAFMFPMIELARDHVYYVDEVFYVHNKSNSLSHSKLFPKEKEICSQYLRGLTAYQPLNDSPISPLAFNEQDQSDLVIFSYNRPLQLYALLESVQRFATNLGKIFVIYRVSEKDYEKSYGIVKSTFPQVTYIRQNHMLAYKEFKPMVLKMVFDEAISRSKYITFAVDDLIIKDKIDFKKSIELLEKYQGYAFFFRLGKNINYCYMTDEDTGIPDPLLKLESDVYAWQFNKGKGDWNYPNTVDLTLYRKKDLKDLFNSIYFTFPNDFESEWAKKADSNTIGLCYEKSKMVNLPMNIVSNYNTQASNLYSVETLHEFFKNGKKIDLNSICQLKNSSCHVDFDPKFVRR